MLPLKLILRWAAYMAMTPNQQTLEDADRVLPTWHTMALLAWWWQNPVTLCPACGVEFEQVRPAGNAKLRRYCTITCRNHADYLRRRAA